MVTEMSPRKADVLARLTEADVQRVYESLGVQRFGSGGQGNWLVCSPFRADRHPSLSIRREDGVWNDKATGESGDIFHAIMRVKGCEFGVALEELARVVGVSGAWSLLPDLSRLEVAASYPYHDADGTLLYEVRRLVGDDGQKTFRARRPVGDGWEPSMGDRRVLYRLPALLAADTATPVFVVEGEKDADRLHALGLVATTAPGGAGKWRPEYSDALAGREVVVIPDNDAPGEQHAAAVVAAVGGLAGSVRVVRLAGLPDKGDVSDWLDAGGTAEALLAQAEATEAMSAELLACAATTAAEAPKPSSRAVVRRMSDVSARAVEWLWPGWLPVGKLSLIGGHAGAGKSTLTAEFAALLSRGLPWPGAEQPGPAVPTHSLFLLGEDAFDDTLRPRLDQLGADPGYVLAIESIEDSTGRERMFTLREHMAELEAAIVEHGVRLVVIDPLSSFMGKANRNDEGEVRDVLTPLLQLADRCGCAILGVMHVGKPAAGGRRTAQQSLMGSTGFVAVARSILITAQVPETDRRVLATVKANLSMIPQAQEWSRADNGPVVWHGPTTQDVEAILGGIPGSIRPDPREVAQDLLREMLANGPLPSREVEAALMSEGISKRTIERARDALGIVSKRLGSSRGAWYLATSIEEWEAFVQSNVAGSTPGAQEAGGVPVAVSTGNRCFDCGAPCGGALRCSSCAAASVSHFMCRGCGTRKGLDEIARRTGFCEWCRERGRSPDREQPPGPPEPLQS